MAVHLNDARCALMLADGGVRAEPAFAWLHGDGLSVGNAAFSESRRHPRSVNNRFLSTLSTDPMRDARFSHLTSADLAAALLEDLLAEHRNREVVFVVPGFFDKPALGVLLGIAGELNVEVSALVDASVAASRRLFDGAELVNFELGLHASVLTLIDQQAELNVVKHVVLEDCGLEALRQRWLEMIAGQFVEQSRFDPLHSADVEQVTLNALSAWLSDARRGATVTAVVKYAGLEHQAELDPLMLQEAVGGIYQRIADALRALSSAGRATTVQLDASADALPGFSEYLRSRAAAELFVIDADAPLQGALARLSAVKRLGPRRLVRSLPPDQAAVTSAAAQQDSAADRPSHVLLGATARVLNGEALIIGSGSGDASRRIHLPDGLAGVSQNHCSIHQESDGCVLSDHSRYGTYLNGNRVHGSTLLRSGDVVRVGTPGVELKLIRVMTDDGS
ncbi:MAG: FHA domain-containing protein [Pseudomonadota bacterium]